MKKAIFISLFILLASAVFAQRTALRTSEGVYYVSINYEGQYIGQKTYNENIAAARENASILTSIGLFSSVFNVEKLTKGQWEAVNNMLNRYQTTKGDTYYINIGLDEESASRIIFICEFTSNTQYNYWAFLVRDYY